MSNSNKKITNETSGNEVAKSDSTSTMLYSFPEMGKGGWRIQDDVVMGGRSDSQLKMTDNNHAYFSGRVSLENNGGFCSIHQTVEKDPYKLPNQSKSFLIRLKGDGKDYNFRVRTERGRHSYAYTFSTKGNDVWETITIPFDEMKATYRGGPVNVPNYEGEPILEMQLLIGNKKEETFEIRIESIEVL